MKILNLRNGESMILRGDFALCKEKCLIKIFPIEKLVKQR